MYLKKQLGEFIRKFKIDLLVVENALTIPLQSMKNILKRSGNQ